MQRAFLRSAVACAIVAAVALAAARPAAGKDAVYIGYKFSQGFSQSYKVKFTQEVDFGGFAMSQFVDMTVTESCVKAADKTYMMEMSFDEVDSGRRQNDELVEDPMGDRLKGQKVSFSVDRHGAVSDISPVGYIEGWDKMSKTVEAVVKNWYAWLPDTLMTPGQDWTREEPDTSVTGLTVHQSTHYVFEEMKKEKGRQCARISAVGENTVKGSQDTPGGKMDVDGSGKTDTEMFLDPATSTMVKFRAKLEMSTDIKAESGGGTRKMATAITMEREVK